MLEKERGYRDKEEESDKEANEGNSSDSNEEEEPNSENSQPEESHNSGPESDGEEEAEDSDPCQHCKGSHGYDTVVMKCPYCFWELCPRSQDSSGTKAREGLVASMLRLRSNHTQG